MKKKLFTFFAFAMALSLFGGNFDYSAYMKEFKSLKSTKNYNEAKELYTKLNKVTSKEITRGAAYSVIIEQCILRIKFLGENKDEVLSFSLKEAERLGLTESQKNGLDFFAKYFFVNWEGAIDYAEKMTEQQRLAGGTSIWMAMAYATKGSTKEHLMKAIDYACAGHQPYHAWFACKKLNDKKITIGAVNKLMDKNIIKVSGAKTAMLFTQLIVENVSNEDAEMVKSYLQRANRNWSMFLLKDAESWKPVITLIRTALEAY